jgi:hypothetical protein
MCEIDIKTGVMLQNPYEVCRKFSIEDARLFYFDGELYVSVSKPEYPAYWFKQYVIRLRDNKEFRPNLNNVNKQEKNWQYFQKNDKLYMIYSIMPFVVYEVNKETFDVKNKLMDHEWKHSDSVMLRCSAPPVLIHGQYYMVVHSVDYKTYIIKFNTSFQLLGCSDALCEDVVCRYDIYFVCGFIYNAITSQFILSVGLNNKRIALISYTKEYVDTNMRLPLLDTTQSY